MSKAATEDRYDKSTGTWIDPESKKKDECHWIVCNKGCGPTGEALAGFIFLFCCLFSRPFFIGNMELCRGTKAGLLLFLLWSPLIWNTAECINIFRRRGDNVTSRPRFAAACIFTTIYLIPYNIFWVSIAEPAKVVLPPWAGGYTNSMLNDTHYYCPHFDEAGAEQEIYDQKYSPDQLYCNSVKKQLDMNIGLQKDQQEAAQQVLLDNAYIKYRKQVWGDLPWYFVRNAIIAYGAVNYHREMVKQYKDEEDEAKKKEEDTKKEGGDYEATSLEGGEYDGASVKGGIEMRNLMNEHNRDDDFVKFV